MNASQRGSWMEVEAGQRLPCMMCGAVQEPGAQIRYDPEVPGLVCGTCGQPEPDEDGPGPEPDGITGQFIASQRAGGLLGQAIGPEPELS